MDTVVDTEATSDLEILVETALSSINSNSCGNT